MPRPRAALDPWLAPLLLAGALLAAAPSFARELPPALQGGLQRVGEGELRWFGLKLYDAALWAMPDAAAEPVDDEAEVAQVLAADHALSIRYARAVSSARLVELSLGEMRRLGYEDEAQLARWAQALACALPSVEAGETLVGLHRPGEGAQFWHQGQPTAALEDAELAAAFFAIWLDPRTREPRLRAQLLGLAERAR